MKRALVAGLCLVGCAARPPVASAPIVVPVAAREQEAPAAPSAAPAPAPAPVLPPIGIKGAPDAKILDVRLVPKRSEIEVDLGVPSGKFLGVNAAESRVLQLVDDRGVSVLAPGATIYVFEKNDRLHLRLASNLSVARDARRLIARVKLVYEIADSTAVVRATLAPAADQSITTTAGAVHAVRTDGVLRSDSTEDGVPPKKSTVITFADIGDADRYVTWESARVGGKSFPYRSTSSLMTVVNGKRTDTRLYIFPPTSRPIELSLTVTTPKLETMDLEIVAGVPE